MWYDRRRRHTLVKRRQPDRHGSAWTPDSTLRGFTRHSPISSAVVATMRVISVCLVLLFMSVLLLNGDNAFASAKKSTPTPTPVVEEETPTPATETPVPETAAPVAEDATPADSTASVAATPAPGPSPVPIHSAQAGSTTFRLMNNLVCPKEVSDKVYAFYAKNKGLFVTCMDKSGYQIFPYSGKVPTAQDITLMVQSPECMGVITAVTMAELPACSISDMPVKAVVETLLKISVDMANGGVAPSATEFHTLMAWRRDVNLAYEAGQPYDGDSELYGIFKKALWKALANTSVKVLSDLTILIDNGAAQTFSDTSSASLADAAGTVQAGDASGSAAVLEPAVAPSTSETTTQSSPAVRPIASSAMLALPALLSLARMHFA